MRGAEKLISDMQRLQGELIRYGEPKTGLKIVLLQKLSTCDNFVLLMVMTDSTPNMTFTDCCRVVRECVQRHMLIQSGASVGRIVSSAPPTTPIPPHESAFDDLLPASNNSQSAVQCFNCRGAHYLCDCDALVCRGCKSFFDSFEDRDYRKYLDCPSKPPPSLPRKEWRTISPLPATKPSLPATANPSRPS